jgi:radical SAM protein with 4Fe4S-binding SPASM domain
MHTDTNPYARILRKTQDRLIPFIVHWELTYHCNLQCPHCYVVPAKSGKELSLEEVTGVLDILKQNGTLYVIFTGGEILTREDFFDIAGYAREKGFALRLLTNGTLIDGTTADRIRDLNPLTVEISLYGSKAETHDRITGCPGSFERSLNALRLLNERELRTVVKSLTMRENVSEFRRLKQLAQEIGSQFLYDTVIIPKTDGSMEPCSLRLNREELYSLLYPEVQETNMDRTYREDDLSCSAGLNAFSISPYGDVYPCAGFKESGGNVRNQSISEIRHSPIFSRIRSITLSDLRECRECELIPYCNRCPALAWMESGNLLGRSEANCLLASVMRSIVDEKRRRAETEMRTPRAAQNAGRRE